MYFDTLKVSKITQAAEHVSARGGLGNLEQVIWDYNKELSISLQDALYTPASQSLLWGGLYSLRPIKLKGKWVPIEYEKDDYGNPIYCRKDVQNRKVNNNYVKIICPCDNEEKWISYVSNSKEPQIVEGRPLKYNDKVIHFTDFSDDDKVINIYEEEDFDNIGYNAEITIDNFSDFGFDIYNYEETENDFTVVDYKTNPNISDMNQTQQNIVEYRWTTCLASLVSEDSDVERAITDKVSFYVQSFNDNDNKRILFQNKYEQGDTKYSYLNFYRTIVKNLQGYDEYNHPIKKEITMNICLGTFYIIEEWNMLYDEVYAGLHQINDGIERVKLRENLEKVVAQQQFAIDINKNIQAYNVLKSPKYIKSNVISYLDPKTLFPYKANAHVYKKQNGEKIYGDFKIFSQQEEYLKLSRKYSEKADLGERITIDGTTFPIIFKLVGETIIKDRYGLERRYQIEIPKCKLLNNISLDLSAGGEPSTVDMEIKAMQLENGVIAKLTTYDIEEKCQCDKKITMPIVPEIIEEKPVLSLEIERPTYSDIYCVEKDCRISDYTKADYTYLRLPSTQAEATAAQNNWENHREILLVKVMNNGVFDRYLLASDSQSFSITQLGSGQ